jgi:2-phospho-L-lactate/phosphoenolpyruvate guanylyltransferase
VVRFILPVKGFARGKTRLGLSPAQRSDLTMAMLADCITASLATGYGPVLVVSPDPQVRRFAELRGASALHNPGGLNDAVSAACGPGRNAALLPDVPAVRADELAMALDSCESGFVPDAAGTGTTLLFGEHLAPAFGPGSAHRHEQAGCRRLDIPLCGLRVDVDTWDDLLIARSFGLGTATAELATRLGADPAARIDP